MKKILFVSSRFPFSNIYSGDRIRAKAILAHLSKKNKIDLVCSDDKINFKVKTISFKGNLIFYNYNKIFQIINSALALLKLKPMQTGYFYSKDIKNFIEKNHSKYNTIIFHLLRCAHYLPKNFKGKKILEMTDVSSYNYKQSLNKLSILNPAFYLYLIEFFLISKYEKFCSKIFDKTVIVSKKDLSLSSNLIKRKTIVIPLGVNVSKKIFKYNKNNNKILFIGNIKYLPNKLACYDFIKNLLPKVNKKLEKVEFSIVGEINPKDRVYLEKFKNVKVHGPLKNLDKIIKKSICAIANLQITSGFQTKILSYMSFGIPTISSSNSFSGKYNLIKNKELLVYQNNKEFLKYIFKLKSNKNFSNKISVNGYKKIKNEFIWSKSLRNYEKII